MTTVETPASPADASDPVTSVANVLGFMAELVGERAAVRQELHAAARDLLLEVAGELGELEGRLRRAVSGC